MIGRILFFLKNLLILFYFQCKTYNKHKTLVHKINFKIKITICVRKYLTKVKLKRKNLRQQKNKQTNKRNKQT